MVRLKPLRSSEFVWIWCNLIRKALVIGNSVFCNISVRDVINYSMAVLSMGNYLKCDSLC